MILWILSGDRIQSCVVRSIIKPFRLYWIWSWLNRNYHLIYSRKMIPYSSIIVIRLTCVSVDMKPDSIEIVGISPEGKTEINEISLFFHCLILTVQTIWLFWNCLMYCITNWKNNCLLQGLLVLGKFALFIIISYFSRSYDWSITVTWSCNKFYYRPCYNKYR